MTKKSNTKTEMKDTKSEETKKVANTKTDSKKEKKETKKEKKETKQTVEPTVTATASASSDSDDKKKRVTPTKESVLEGFDQLQTLIDEEVNKIRESSKSKGVKFLRTLGKKVKNLRTSAARVMKSRNKGERKVNLNSGFQKPVTISKEMAKFAGWNATDLKSRVEVTKRICDYVKENKLQDPEDRRKINADKKLSDLLGYDSGKDEPLTYYRLQTHIKKHFPKP